VVLVATIRALKINGGLTKDELDGENVPAVKKGCANLLRHIENIKQFGLPVVVAINHFATDTDAEIDVITAESLRIGVKAIRCEHRAKGSEGTIELAEEVVSVCEASAAQFSPLYEDSLSLFEKIKSIATRIYRADDVAADMKIRNQLREWEAAGFGHLPVCMAKTQYSFSTDPSLRGAPLGHIVPVREVRLSAGAGFIVVICGDIMTMPGLPRIPAAENIGLDADGKIEGLF